MCGRINVSDDEFTKGLMQVLGVAGQSLRAAPDIAPAAPVSIVWERDGQRMLATACWWLLLDPATLKPNYRYASFNCRSDKLQVPRSASYRPFRTQRCIFPISGFVEGLGDKKHYFQLQGVDRALALGGVYRTWQHRETGEMVISAAIITLPGHPRMQNIHPKSQPLILPQDQPELLDKWLDSEQTDVEIFTPLLQPKLPQDLQVTPIKRPGLRRPIADSYLLQADAA